jgi:hypothetical protein
MKIKMLALILALTTTMWAQTANPTTSDKDSAAASSTASACCDKMAKDSKDMPCCHGKDVKGEMACCHGKDAKGDMACCNGKDAKACMRASKDAGSCCGKDAACGQEGVSCCGAKGTAEATAKGCCAGGKCDRHAHQHASGM